jgi:hypothetical protein
LVVLALKSLAMRGPSRVVLEHDGGEEQATAFPADRPWRATSFPTAVHTPNRVKPPNPPEIAKTPVTTGDLFFKSLS